MQEACGSHAAHAAAGKQLAGIGEGIGSATGKARRLSKRGSQNDAKVEAASCRWMQLGRIVGWGLAAGTREALEVQATMGRGSTQFPLQFVVRFGTGD